MNSLFNWSSGNEYRRPTAWGTIAEPVKGEEAAFREVKRLVLSHVKVSPNSVNDFQISPRSQIATYTDPSGRSEEIDLPGIEDPRIQEALAAFYEITPGAKIQMRCAQVIAGSKGNQSGYKTLRRTTSALNNLPTDFDYSKHIPSVLAKESSVKNRREISRRFLFVENFLGKWKEKINERGKAKQKELNNPALPDRQALKLRKELQELNKIQSQLENIDMYALSRALEQIPVGRLNRVTLDEIAEKLQQAVLEDIKPKKWLGAKRAEHSEADIEYAKDVAGMLYCERKSYFDYCNKVFDDTKREGPADIFLREAIRFAASQGEYTAEGFKESILLNDMSDDLKKEVQDDLNATGVLASHAIEDIDLKEYETADIPEDATNEEKAKLQRENIAKMQKALKAHKEKINKDLKLANIPPTPEQDPGVRSMVKHVVVPAAAATAGAMVAAGTLTGIIDPQIAWQLGQYVLNNPVPVIASAALLYALRHRVAPFVPEVRSIVSNVVLPAAAAGAIVAAGAYAGIIDPQMPLQLVNYIQNHPARMIASASILDSLRHQVVSFVSPQVRDPETGHVRRRFNYRRMAIGTAVLATLSAIAMYNETSRVILQSIAQAVDFVWNNTYLPFQVNTQWIPGLSYLWQGNIPVLMALRAVSIINRIPVVGPVVGSVIKPMQRALSYVATTSGLVPLAQGVAGKGLEYGKPVYDQGSHFAKTQGGRVAEFVHGIAQGIWQKMPAMPAMPKMTFILDFSKAPLTIM